jgi:hypothetical protein
MRRIDQRGAALSGLIMAVMGLSLMISLGFGLWAFTSREDYKNKADIKIAAAAEQAKLAAEEAKELDFAEREKNPLKTYTAPAAQGSISFTFPKTWSALITESSQSGNAKPLDGFFYPNYLPGVETNSTASYALRLELLTQAYSQVITPFNSQATAGTVKVTAYTPEKVPSALGVKIEGTLPNKKEGIMIVLPLRDKTIKLWTESKEFAEDFNTRILPSLTFSP